MANARHPRSRARSPKVKVREQSDDHQNTGKLRPRTSPNSRTTSAASSPSWHLKSTPASVALVYREGAPGFFRRQSIDCNSSDIWKRQLDLQLEATRMTLVVKMEEVETQARGVPWATTLTSPVLMTIPGVAARTARDENRRLHRRPARFKNARQSLQATIGFDTPKQHQSGENGSQNGKISKHGPKLAADRQLLAMCLEQPAITNAWEQIT